MWGTGTWAWPSPWRSDRVCLARRAAERQHAPDEEAGAAAAPLGRGVPGPAAAHVGGGAGPAAGAGLGGQAAGRLPAQPERRHLRGPGNRPESFLPAGHQGVGGTAGPTRGWRGWSPLTGAVSSAPGAPGPPPPGRMALGGSWGMSRAHCPLLPGRALGPIISARGRAQQG